MCSSSGAIRFCLASARIIEPNTSKPDSTECPVPYFFSEIEYAVSREAVSAASAPAYQVSPRGAAECFVLKTGELAIVTVR